MVEEITSWLQSSFGWQSVLTGYAAILSTIVFIWNVRKSRGWIRVKVVHGVETHAGEVVFGIHVSIQNHSNQAVYVRNVSILYPCFSNSLFAKFMHFVRYRRAPTHVGWVHVSPDLQNIETGLPVTLEPGDSHGFLLPEESLLKLVKDRIKPVLMFAVQDALWRTTYSNKTDFQK
jgi:hypothetical protein